MNKIRLIDADALWLDIANRSACLHDCCPRTKGKKGVLLLIDEAPTIEAEPVRHGRWVRRGNKWQCTHCKILMDIDGTPEENLLNYCTYCGTKMDGKEVKKDG